MNDNSLSPAPITPIAEWNGPALNNPALAGDGETLERFLSDPCSVPTAAIWLAVMLGASVSPNGSDEIVAKKVGPFVAAWRGRHGEAKVDELKQQVIAELKKGKVQGSEAEIRRRVETLFSP